MGKIKITNLLAFIIISIGIILSIYLIIYNTNILFKQEDSTFIKSYSIKPITDEADGGYIKIISDSRTPSVKDWTRFYEGTKVSYFSINKGEVINKEIYITTPMIVEQGKYYFGLEIHYNSGEVKTDTISFKVV